MDPGLQGQVIVHVEGGHGGLEHDVYGGHDGLDQ